MIELINYEQFPNSITKHNYINFNRYCLLKNLSRTTKCKKQKAIKLKM